MESELSLIRFTSIQFFSVLMSSRPFQPISTLLIKLVDALISSEPEPDLPSHKRVEWIYEHTHINVNTPLSIIELAVFRNLDKGLNFEIEIGEKSYYLTELYGYLDEISKELTNMVITICKKYSMDFPVLNTMSNQKIDITN